MSWPAALREAWHNVLGNPAAATVLLLAAIIYSFYYPIAYHLQVAIDLPIVVVDLDHSALSREIVRDTSAMDAVTVVDMPVDMLAAQAQLNAGVANGVLLIPADLESRVIAGKSTSLVLYGNGGYLIRNAAVLSGLAEVAIGAVEKRGLKQAAVAGIAAEPLLKQLQPVQIVSRPLFNTRNGYGSYAVPAVAILIVQQVLLIGGGLIVCGLGRLQRWRPEQFGSHLLLHGLVGCLFIAWYAGFVFWLQDYPRGGNGPALLLAAPLYIAAVTTLAMLIGSLFTDSARILLLLTISSVPLFFLSGVSWPLTMMPSGLFWLGKLVPSTSGIQMMLKLNQMGASVAEVQAEMANLAVLALCYGGLAWWRLGHARRSRSAG